MLKAERHAYLLQQLSKHGRLSAIDEAEQLGISEDTLRRDLRELDAAGSLQRVHGGAIPKPPVPASYAERRGCDQARKSSLARVAASLVSDGEVFFLDGGTTALCIAESLPVNLRATIVTNAPAIAAALTDHPGVDVYMAGGAVAKRSAVTIGAEATDFLRRFRASLSFIGVCALSADTGLTIPFPEESSTKRVMIEQATRVVALASNDKLDIAYPYIVAPTTAITDLVTDCAATEDRLAPYKLRGIVIHRGA
ncbi:MULTISPECIES: DeoR/GlpR family DNA-binding transcription regulator [Chromohalobacter]|uniref:DeoR family transcriptional regulator n=1 Tax=Chromohalobacter marismortui TaxID=42055 RepID=A0A4R7NUE4_9GAMM|nr:MULTISPECIES: DeoR/GlpR family DNA-binding transcription regulator [Chromohalobacter]MCI0509010.1 DeoR/GlpR family DNA-binding transcription regulator [Chromohalobacter sp.]MCI0592885.1 DeoR/GlpR family DNA-binding transcription regulator [Chromohalobacter sp.]MCK0751729.1 DeoR/GlpR family DNA-binding transcription regulator [Chromohalobacter japonicus]TDU24100.1 DeoR family transcriptional regulator [Chromohalobacter marismortui]